MPAAQLVGIEHDPNSGDAGAGRFDAGHRDGVAGLPQGESRTAVDGLDGQFGAWPFVQQDGYQLGDVLRAVDRAERSG